MLIVRQPDTYPSERAYALEVVLGEFLGLEWATLTEARRDVEITAPELSGEQSLVVADCLFEAPEHIWLTEASLPVRPLASWNVDRDDIAPTLVSANLPVIYGREVVDGSFYHETKDAVRLGVDIFGSIFFQLTRYEEIALSARDEHDRFPAGSSLACREGFLTRPLVNEYVEVLWSTLERMWPLLRRRTRTPRDRPSHDVDWPQYTPSSPPKVAKAMIGDMLRGYDRGLALTRLGALRSRWRADPASDPYNTFDFIMDLSERRGVQSAFYFMSGATDQRFDSGYGLEDPWIGALIRRIHERGHEVGLHPSYGTFRDRDAVRSEWGALLRACERLGIEQREWGGRQHFLRWENPTTWRNWEAAGLTYDSSLGFPHHPGFRCGVCYEYPVFDLIARRRLGLRERPLVAMEISLFHPPATSEEDALAKLERLRSRCRLFGGDFTLLWHNSRLASRRERRLYATVMAGKGQLPA